MMLISNSRNPEHFVPRANAETVEDYRKHMIAMFGNTNLPAVRYKGEVIPPRKL